MLDLLILGVFLGLFGNKINKEPEDPQLRKEIRKIRARNQTFAPRKK